MKLHWGNALFLFFTLYIGFLGFTLYQSTQVDHSLVAKDYYAEDLAYQEKYDKLENYARTATPLRLEYDASGRQLSIIAPKGLADCKGNLTFYRPSEAGGDIQREISLSGGEQLNVPASDLAAGRWIAQLDYSSSGKGFYTEKDIFVR